MKTRRLVKIISILLVVITVFTAAAPCVSASEKEKEVIILTQESPLRNAVYTGLGFVVGVLYLSKHVSPIVLAETVISMLGHDYSGGKGVAYILEVAASYIPKENWENKYPHPYSVNYKREIISFYMDVRFLDKRFCADYAEGIINKFGDGTTLFGLGKERIAVEIYGHAMVHFGIQAIRSTPFYLLFREKLDNLYKRSDPIEVNVEETHMEIFNAIWRLL